MRVFSITGKVFKYPGAGGSHFITVGAKESKILKESKIGARVSWSFVKVRATIGKTSWNTGLFPTKEGPYLLAIKATVRKAEGIDEGDFVKAECILL